MRFNRYLFGKIPLVRLMIYIAAGGILGSMTCAIIPKFDGRLDPPPDPEGRRIRNILMTAGTKLYESYAPEVRERIELKLAQTLKEINRQNSRFWFRRDFTEASHQLGSLQDEAVSFLKEIHDQSEKDKTDARDMILNAERKIRKAREVMKRLPGNSAYDYMAEAEIRLADAKRYLEQQEFLKAAFMADRSLEKIALATREGQQIFARFLDPDYLAWCRDHLKQAVNLSKNNGPTLVVIKDKRRMDIYNRGKIVRSMNIDLGFNGMNRKLMQGDRGTPEGSYQIIKKKGRGQTKFGLAFLIDYPNAEDRQRFDAAKRRKEIPYGVQIGGLIEIHGQGGRGADWTDGCVAVSDEDMRWLYDSVPLKTRVFIIGTDGIDSPIHTYFNEGSP